MVNRVSREDGLDAPKLMQHVTLLLLHVDNMVIFLYGVDGMQPLLGALKEFDQSSGLTINVETKMKIVQTIEAHEYPVLTYNREHVQFV